jgi:hypothetical protein
MTVLPITEAAEEAISRCLQSLENPSSLDKNQVLNVVSAAYNELCKVYKWENANDSSRTY